VIYGLIKECASQQKEQYADFHLYSLNSRDNTSSLVASCNIHAVGLHNWNLIKCPDLSTELFGVLIALSIYLAKFLQTLYL